MNQPIKVIVHRTALSASPGGCEMQQIATVYVGGEEYRVQAPPAVDGAAIEWLDHASVVYTSKESIGPGDVEATHHISAYVRMLVRQELEKSLNATSGSGSSGSFYHVRLHALGGPAVEMKFDLSRSDLESRVLTPYQNLQPIVLAGRTFLIENLARLQVFESPFPG
jgi:hypothetical protein